MYLLCISYSFIYMLHSRYTCYIRIFRLSSVLEVEITEVLEMSLSLVIASVPVALPMVMKVTLSIGAKVRETPLRLDVSPKRMGLNWMVYKGNPSINGWWLGVPILGKPFFWNGLLMEMDSPLKNGDKNGLKLVDGYINQIYQGQSTCQHVNVSWIVYIYISSE